MCDENKIGGEEDGNYEIFRSLPLSVDGIAAPGEFYDGEEDVFRSGPSIPSLVSGGDEYGASDQYDAFSKGLDLSVIEISVAPSKPLPPYFLDVTHFSLDGSSTDVAQKIALALTANDADFTFNSKKYKFKGTACVENYMIDFRVRVFSDEGASHIVEFQKRDGSSMHWHAFYRNTLTHINPDLVPEPRQGGMRARVLPPPVALLPEEAPTPAEYAAECAAAASMAKSEFVDVQSEGVRLLADVTKDAGYAMAFARSASMSADDYSSMLASTDPEVVRNTSVVLANVAAALKAAPAPAPAEATSSLAQTVPALLEGLRKYQAENTAAAASGYVFAAREVAHALSALMALSADAVAAVSSGDGNRLLASLIERPAPLGKKGNAAGTGAAGGGYDAALSEHAAVALGIVS